MSRAKSGAPDCGRVSVSIVAGVGLGLSLLAVLGPQMLRAPEQEEILVSTSMDQPAEEFEEGLLIQEFEITEGDPDLLSDSPFENREFNTTSSLGADAGGHRAAFLELVDRARELQRVAGH